MNEYWVTFKPTKKNMLNFISTIGDLNDINVSIRCFHMGTRNSTWAVKMDSIYVGRVKLLNGFKIELVPMVVTK